jgi:ANTAR domain
VRPATRARLIEHAKGVMVRPQGLDPDQAYPVLRSLTGDQGLTVTEVARPSFGGRTLISVQVPALTAGGRSRQGGTSVDAGVTALYLARRSSGRRRVVTTTWAMS